jgi:hypothetical protein
MTRHDPVHLMSAAADTIRAFNSQSRPARLPDGCVVAPDAYSIIGSAGELAHGMPQALSQLVEALHRSLSVYHVDDRDERPAESVAAAARSLSSAGHAFTVAVQHLSDALFAIADP